VIEILDKCIFTIKFIKIIMKSTHNFTEFNIFLQALKKFLNKFSTIRARK
jgi:hypothetical protein